MAPHLFSGPVMQAAAGAAASAEKAAASVSVAIILMLGLLHVQKRGPPGFHYIGRGGAAPCIGYFGVGSEGPAPLQHDLLAAFQV